MASVSACGADFIKSRLRLGIVAEHAASMRPHAVTAMTRLMIPHLGGIGPPLPQNTAIKSREIPRNLGPSACPLWLPP